VLLLFFLLAFNKVVLTFFCYFFTCAKPAENFYRYFLLEFFHFL